MHCPNQKMALGTKSTKLGLEANLISELQYCFSGEEKPVPREMISAPISLPKNSRI